MLHITKKVGSQFAVYDDEDGVLEWVSNDDIQKAKGLGLQFSTGEVTVAPNMCNFGKDGANIFAGASYSSKGSGKYEMTGGGKKFKFQLKGDVMKFTIGVNVSAVAAGFSG